MAELPPEMKGFKFNHKAIIRGSHHIISRSLGYPWYATVWVRRLVV
jgi:hypothetical protein